ncbi:Gp37-like protein [Sediminibacillus terrae]|uniref:Gp37-like protein n=1 Tax=Sediminibacillus terrae TaxID=1562106 RepID=UPI001295C91D|nr:hypothetical protein [Sediminibacillus terrae]
MKRPIRVYTPYLDLEKEFERYESLQFPRSFYGKGEFELHINRYMDGAEVLKKGNIIVLDKKANKAGIILTREIALDEKGKASENWKITGYTLDGLISRRQTVPSSDDAGGYDRKSGDAETVMKHYVKKHFVNPEDPKRKMPMIEVAPNKHRGDHIAWESRFKVVSDEFETIGKQTGLGWTVYADTANKKFIFDVMEMKDLTKGNKSGFTPVVFSPEFGTIKDQSFTDSDKDYKNVGYVGGPGEGEERIIVQVGEEAEGLERIETFIDARDIGSEDEEQTNQEVEHQLKERGEQKLLEKGRLLSFEAQIFTPITEEVNRIPNGKPIAKTPFEYEVDFDIGCRVTILNKKWGIMLAAPIVELKEIHEVNGFTLEGTFGEAKPTLITKIKKRFDELTGVEQQEFPVKYSKVQLEKSIKYTNEGLTKEEQERIKQAEENLKKSKEHTEEYAEQKFYRGPTEPENKQLIWIDTSNPDQDLWKRWDEATNSWQIGPGGPQGVQGPPGQDGQTYWTWIKYADDELGNGMSDNPTGKSYMGISYNNESAVESSNPADYQWAKVEGPQGPEGPQGVEGPPGADGQTRYTWIRYADDEQGNGMSNIPDGKEYIGLSYNNVEQTESDDPADYSWSKYKGDKGEKGETGPQGIQGPPGEDGQPRFTWIRYADDVNGNGMSNYPDGKRYIGLAHNKTTATESTDPSDYTWAKIEGETGPQGPEGDQGPRGPQGPNIVDTNTSFGVNWLVADYIKSLNGLNVGNGQFVVDDDGNVRFGGELQGPSGTFGNVSVVDGNFVLKDSTSGMEYNIASLQNYILDHSFELIRGNGNVNYDYMWLDYNSGDSNNVRSSLWKSNGTPRVGLRLDNNSHTVDFGNQNICVRNSDYVSQFIPAGKFKVDTVYSVSAHFRRQRNVSAGARPRISIQLYDDIDGTIIETFQQTTFPEVPSDYSSVRRSTTFSIPASRESDLVDYVSVRIVFWGANNYWHAVDGAQLVMGKYPSIYAPEEGLYSFLSGTDDLTLREGVRFGHLSGATFDKYGNLHAPPSASAGAYWNIQDYEDNVILKVPWGSDGGDLQWKGINLTLMEHLWSGSIYPKGDQEAYPSKKLSECKTGWILVWSDYDVGSGSNDFNWVFSIIPKRFGMTSLEGGGCYFVTPNSDNLDHGAKYIYVYNDHIRGNDGNNNAPLNDVVLRYIFEC